MMNRVNQLYQRRHQMLWLHHMMSVEHAHHTLENGTAWNTEQKDMADSTAERPDWQEDTR
jgi:hypothetical protein